MFCNSDEAAGEGVERAVLCRACTLVAADYLHFADSHCGIYRIPQFLNQEVPHRLARWKAYGTVIALNLIRVHAAPLPISPFLLMALLNKHNQLLVDERIIARFAYASAVELHPWFQLLPTDDIPHEYDHPVIQFLSDRNLMVRF